MLKCDGNPVQCQLDQVVVQSIDVESWMGQCSSEFEVKIQLALVQLGI